MKKKGKSPFRRLVGWLHLWLGLGSGLIVFIISITGCIYAFEQEIRSVTQRYQFVTPQYRAYLPPSQLRTIAYRHAFGNRPDTGENRIRSVQYGSPGKAAIAAYDAKGQGYTMIYLNPYTGQVLHEKILEADFFRIILAGHFYLWLPKEIGQPVIASAVLVFVVLLITGIILWWPRNRKPGAWRKSPTVKRGAKFKRLNYDLHNVLGFYVWTIALVLSLTGLVWGFKWFAGAAYWATSGGRTLPVAGKSTSDTTKTAVLWPGAPPEDVLWQRMDQEYGHAHGTLQVQFPQKAADVFVVQRNPEEGTYYKREFRRFDRYTLQEVAFTRVYRKRYAEASGADRLHRMNYDIHVGAVLGLPGKVLAFFASLICASLPVTGFLFWWGRRQKKERKRQTKARRLLEWAPPS